MVLRDSRRNNAASDKEEVMTDTYETPDSKQYPGKQEIEECLEKETDWEGKLWRLKRGKGEVTQAEAANELETSKGTVFHASVTLDAIRSGTSPDTPSTAEAVRRRLGSFRKRHKDFLSKDAIDYLNDLIDKCRESADNSEKKEKEQSKRERETANAEKNKTPGIYVYTLPHYHTHPFQPAPETECDRVNDRTLLKIGMSATDAKGRTEQVTGLPEVPILLRIYGRDDFGKSAEKWKEIEGKFHQTLIAFGHYRNRRNRDKGAGKEWFLTDLDALDQLAHMLDLKTKYRIPEE